jgi:hypothetical protein
MIPLLIEACPSFKVEWDKHCEECEEHSEKILYYVVLGDFAHHLLELFQKQQVETFPAVARVIEQLHVEGDSYVREAATIGLLEGIQNGWGNNNVNPELFFPYLLPVSAKWWQSLNSFWTGKSKFVGEGLNAK